MKIVIIADWHCGKDRIGRHRVSPEVWDAPAREAVAWAVENDADAFVVAGDLFDKRNPTTAEYERALAIFQPLHHPRQFGGAGIPIDTWIIDGNHDIGASVASTPATWPFRVDDEHYCHFTGAASVNEHITDALDLNLIALPWPRPVDYFHPGDQRLGLADELASTRDAVLTTLQGLASNPDPSLPAILVGHAMVAYGEAAAQSPNLLLGKDVVLPYDYLTSLPNVGAVALGHVHQPGRGYVGSTQPTDFADVEPKSFTVIEITEGERRPPTRFSLPDGWDYETTTIPYETSLRAGNLNWKLETRENPLGHLKEDLAQMVHYDEGAEPDFDVARVSVALRPDQQLEPHEVYAAIHDRFPSVTVESVTIDRPRERPTRLAEDTPSLVAVSPAEAARTWLAQSGYDAARTKAAMDEFSKVLAEVSDGD